MKFMKCYLVPKEHSLIFLTLEMVRAKQVVDVLNAIANDPSPTSIFLKNDSQEFYILKMLTKMERALVT